MWRLLEYLLAAMIVLLAFTEFFYPLFRGKPLFGSFRRSSDPAVTSETNDLHKKMHEAREKVRDVKEVQDQVNQNFKTAEELKEEADRLLQRPRDPDLFS